MARRSSRIRIRIQDQNAEAEVQPTPRLRKCNKITSRCKPSKRSRSMYMREYRAKLKTNASAYIRSKKADAARKRKAKAERKLQSRSEMTDREVRFVRKRGREYVQKHRSKKKQLEINKENIDPQHDASNSGIIPPIRISVKNIRSRQKRNGENVRRRNNAALHRKIKSLEIELKLLQRKLWRAQRKALRRKASVPLNELSPNSRTKRITQGKFMPKVVVNEIKFSSALQCELKHTLSLLNSPKEKNHFSRLVSGRILKQYKLLNQLKTNSFVCLKQMRRCRKMNLSLISKDEKRAKTTACKALVEAIQKFFESDTASSACPYKREFKTVDGVRYQKRFLNDTMTVLYRSFISLVRVKASYSSFCKHRQRWIVPRKLNGRDTCLCKKCENFKLLHATARSVKLVNAKDVDELVKTVCCEPQTEECLLGECATCVNNTIQYLPCNSLSPVMYRKWIDATEERPSTKNKDSAGNPTIINVKITKKAEIYTTHSEFQDILSNALRPQMAHLGRIRHQRESIKHLREELSWNELFLTFDWSEDYEGKWGSEPQCTHFGGSRPHFSLHTGRAISRSVEQSFCTLSSVTRHDPKAIIAHLKPILSDYLGMDPNIEHLHVQTDGPVTQYRNTKLYYLLTQHLLQAFPQIKRVTWNITETGHGKSVADAVGGTTKGSLDKEVAQGRDVVTIETVFEVLQRRCPTIKFHVIKGEKITEVDAIYVPELKGAVKGTLQMHQYLWRRDFSDTLHFKKLSCYRCPRDSPCEHYVLIHLWKFPSVPMLTVSSSHKKKKVQKPSRKGSRRSSSGK